MAGLKTPAQWLLDLFGGENSVRVTAKSTLNVPAFWYGINKISAHVGTLPINLHRKLPEGGAEKVTNHMGYRLLRKRPNAYQTPVTFKQTETARAILWGNSRSYIHRAGNSSELIPLRPDASVTGLIEGEKWHATWPDKDERILLFDDMLEEMLGNPHKVVMVPDRDCLHIQGFGDGVQGLSLFEVAKNTIEVGLGADKRTAKNMTKGFAGKIFLETPADSPEFRDAQKAQQFLKEFTEKHGADGAGDQVGLLRGGIKANVLSMSNKDAEFCELQTSNKVDAALFLMLEGILGYSASVSYNSEEQAQLAYLKTCLATWLTRWEEECAFKLLSGREFFGDYYFKFNTGALLRTDMQTTMTTLAQAIAARIKNPNECREQLDLNPYPGGDTFENPAISPGTPGDEEPPEPDPANNAALMSHLEHFLKIEEKQVNKRIQRGETFEQLDAWYDNFARTLGDAIETVGGDRIIAQRHCIASLDYLKRKPAHFSLAGSAEQLVKEIAHV